VSAFVHDVFGSLGSNPVDSGELIVPVHLAREIGVDLLLLGSCRIYWLDLLGALALLIIIPSPSEIIVIFRSEWVFVDVASRYQVGAFEKLSAGRWQLATVLLDHVPRHIGPSTDMLTFYWGVLEYECAFVFFCLESAPPDVLHTRVQLSVLVHFVIYPVIILHTVPHHYLVV